MTQGTRDTGRTVAGTSPTSQNEHQTRDGAQHQGETERWSLVASAKSLSAACSLFATAGIDATVTELAALELGGAYKSGRGAEIRRTRSGWELWADFAGTDISTTAKAEKVSRGQQIQIGDYKLRVWGTRDGTIRFDVDDRAQIVEALTEARADVPRMPASRVHTAEDNRQHIGTWVPAERVGGRQQINLGDYSLRLWVAGDPSISVEAHDRDTIAQALSRAAAETRASEDARACRVTLAQIASMVSKPGERLPDEPWPAAPVDVLVEVQQRFDEARKATPTVNDSIRLALAGRRAKGAASTVSPPWPPKAVDVPGIKPTAAADVARLAEALAVLRRCAPLLSSYALELADQGEDAMDDIAVTRELLEGIARLTSNVRLPDDPLEDRSWLTQRKVAKLIALVSEVADGMEASDDLQERARELLRPQAANGAH